MKNQDTPDDGLFDPRQPGKARAMYIVMAVVVTVSLIVGMAGYAVWDRLF